MREAEITDSRLERRQLSTKTSLADFSRGYSGFGFPTISVIPPLRRVGTSRGLVLGAAVAGPFRAAQSSRAFAQVSTERGGDIVIGSSVCLKTDMRSRQFATLDRIEGYAARPLMIPSDRRTTTQSLSLTHRFTLGVWLVAEFRGGS